MFNFWELFGLEGTAANSRIRVFSSDQNLNWDIFVVGRFRDFELFFLTVANRDLPYKITPRESVLQRSKNARNFGNGRQQKYPNLDFDRN